MAKINIPASSFQHHTPPLSPPITAMSSLFDKKTLKSLQRAWKARLRERKIKPTRHSRWKNRFRLAAGYAVRVYLALIILNVVMTGLELTPDRLELSLIIVFSCLGSLLASWWHVKLTAPSDAFILAATPISNRTLLRHTLRQFVPIILTFLAVAWGLSAIALDQSCLHHETPATWFIICLGIMGISTALFYILGHYINAMTTIMGTLALLVILTAFNFLLYKATWPDAIFPILLNFWPAAWPLDYSRGTLTPLQITLIVGIIATALYYLTQQLKSWKFSRLFREWIEDDFEYEFLDEDLDFNPDLAPQILTQWQSDIDAFQEAPQRRTQWIEWLIWKFSSEPQRDLAHIIRIINIPNYTKKWIKALFITALALLIIYFNGRLFPFYELLNIASFTLFVYATTLTAPLYSFVSLFTDRIPISQHNISPLCTILPVSYRDITSLHWKSGLIRSLFATPVITTILWLIHWNASYTGTTFFLIFNCFAVGVWLQLNWIHLSLCNAWLYSGSGISTVQRSFFQSVVNLFLFLIYSFVFAVTGFIAYASDSLEDLEVVGLGALLTLTLGYFLARFTRSYYQSKRSDLINTIKDPS